MRRISQLSALCLVAGVVNACSLPDEVIPTESIPTAGVRFINAVADTNTMDFRFVDIVESNAQFKIGFRNNPVVSGGSTASTAIQYKNARAGSRHFVVFLDDTLQAVASVKLFDSLYTFDAKKLYTVLIQGTARSTAPVSDKMRLTIFEETAADPGALVAMRVINATNAPIDGYKYLASGAVGAVDWAAVPAYSASAYVTAAAGTYNYQIRDAAGTNPIFADNTALVGSAATSDIEALPGTTVAGSAVTGIVFPGSVSGSNGAQFAVTTGSSRARATAAGYEAPRSYIADGFVVGMPVTASGFTTAANNGASVVASLAAGKTTGTLPTGTLTAASAILTGTATGYTRTSGSFITNGFAVGMAVTATGFVVAANNGESVVSAVTATTLDVTKTGGTALESGTTGSTTLSATAAGYSRTAGSFLADGFQVGQTVTAFGFTALVPGSATSPNNGASVITALAASGLDMSVTKTTGTVVDAAAAGRTILVSSGRSIVSFGAMNVTKAGGTVAEAAANSRTVAASPSPRGISFMWDRRPPRTACFPLC